MNLNTRKKKDESSKSLHAYVDGAEVPLANSGGSGSSTIYFNNNNSTWMQIGDVIVIQGDEDGVLELMLSTEDTHLPNHPSTLRRLWKHKFPKPFPHKCLRVFWWTNDGDSNDDDSDTYHFVDYHGALDVDGFGTEHKHVKYIAFGY